MKSMCSTVWLAFRVCKPLTTLAQVLSSKSMVQADTDAEPSTFNPQLSTLNSRHPPLDPRPCTMHLNPPPRAPRPAPRGGRKVERGSLGALQEYLPHQKQRPPRTLQ